MVQRVDSQPNTEQRRTPVWISAFELFKQELDRNITILLVITLGLVLTSSALAALSPLVLKYVIDQLTLDELQKPFSYITFLILAYAGTQLLGRSLAELQALTIGRADQRLHRRLSVHLFKHMMALPLRFHLDHMTGAMSQTLTNGLHGYRTILRHLVLTIVPVVLEFGIIFAVVLSLDQPIFLAIIGASLSAYTVAFSAGVSRLNEPIREISTSQIDSSALLTDSILNYETIKTFCAEPTIQRRMVDAFTRTEKHWYMFFSRKAVIGTFVGCVFALSLATSLYIAAQKFRQNQMTIGEFVLINAYIVQMFRPIETLGFAFLDTMQGISFIEKMVVLIRQKPETTPTRAWDALPSGPGDLVFDRVSFSYRLGNPVLRNLSFRVHAGETVAIVGPSGAGKSSIVRLLVRFYEPDTGAISIDGVPISTASISSLREAVAVVPQDSALFHDTIAYNIALGRKESSVEDISEAARLADIHDFIVSYSEGYETMVGERGLTLSGGERQRIAIARAALKKPRIFVFDEATSSLDSRSEKKIIQNLQKVSQGKTTLVIAHRLSTVIDADEILVLDNGRIIERGTHRSLLRCAGMYYDMWHSQTKEEVGPNPI